MSRPTGEKSEAAEARTQETRSYVRQVRTATRRKYSAEEKVRIVLEGFRREVTVTDICRREGRKPAAFYAWAKEFMEPGKERLGRDEVRGATGHEVQHPKRENSDLKHLVTELGRPKEHLLSLAAARGRRPRARGWPDEESSALESPPTGGRGRDPGGRSGKAGITQFLLDERRCDPRLSEPASGTIEPADRPSLMLLHPPNLSAQRVSQCC